MAQITNNNENVNKAGTSILSILFQFSCYALKNSIK